MASRREVLQMLAAGGALADTAVAATAHAAPDPPLHRVIVDRRIPGSADFARTLAKGRTPIATIDGDVTELWMHDLSRRWKRGPAAIAGLTGTDSLWVLERLGWDHGLRVTSRRPLEGKPDAVAWLMAPVRRG